MTCPPALVGEKVDVFAEKACPVILLQQSINVLQTTGGYLTHATRGRGRLYCFLVTHAVYR